MVDKEFSELNVSDKVQFDSVLCELATPYLSDLFVRKDFLINENYTSVYLILEDSKMICSPTI
jgi:hypothetical protein